jgi:hypothetical protein
MSTGGMETLCKSGKQVVLRSNVRRRSKTPVATGSPDVCLSPDSGGIADVPQPPLGATSGLSTRLGAISMIVPVRHGWRRRPPGLI